MLFTQNKGEWAESYCLFKIISEGKLLLCNHALELTNELLDVLGGYIGSEQNNIAYKLESNFCNILYNGTVRTLPKEDFDLLQKFILNAISNSKEKTFSIDAVNRFLDTVQLNKIKSSSLTKDDIIIKVDDEHIIDSGYSRFSIKSFMSSSPTLVNASKPTNFIFLLSQNCNSADYTNLTSKTLVRKLYNNNVSLSFHDMYSNIFQHNLMMIDTNMPLILAEALKIYYSSTKKFVTEITEELAAKNPLHLSNTTLYAHKLKDYLFHSSFGIFPDKKWDGLHIIDGGCIIVCKNGDLRTFYILRKKYLEYYRNFLFENAFLDTASNSRHCFGNLYTEENNTYLKLNLQIRLHNPMSTKKTRL